MKTALILSTLMLATSGCAPEAKAQNTTGREEGGAELQSFDGAAATAIRVLHVHQYEDRMPGEEPGPRFITLVEFEVDSCKSLYDGDVKIKAASNGKVSQLMVSVPEGSCSTPTRQTLVGSTNLVKSGHRVTIQNPVLIETLAPSE